MVRTPQVKVYLWVPGGVLGKGGVQRKGNEVKGGKGGGQRKGNEVKGGKGREY